jgi:5,10-methylenetetrahydrofolate reductase
VSKERLQVSGLDREKDPGGLFREGVLPLLSCEVLPPSGAEQGAFKLLGASLAQMGVEVVFLPDAPQGLPRASSLAAAAELQRASGLPCVPHVNTRDRNRLAVEGLVQGAALTGLHGIKAVTGDPVAQESGQGVYEIDSADLVSLVSDWNQAALPGGGQLLTPVVGHTLGEGCSEERLERKVAAGARVVVTTPTLNAADLQGFFERVASLPVEVMVGLAHVPALRVLEYLMSEVTTFHVPQRTVDLMRRATSIEGAAQVGLDAVLDVVRSVRDRAAGFHVAPLFGRVETLPAVLNAVRDELAS